jgi:hypothetical protein
MMPQLNIPARNIVEEEGAAPQENADAFVDPFLAPVKILIILPEVVDARSVFLPQVEWRVGEDGVDTLVTDVRKQLDAIASEQGAKVGHIKRLEAAVHAERT